MALASPYIMKSSFRVSHYAQNKACSRLASKIPMRKTPNLPVSFNPSPRAKNSLARAHTHTHTHANTHFKRRLLSLARREDERTSETARFGPLVLRKRERERGGATEVVRVPVFVLFVSPLSSLSPAHAVIKL